MPFTYTLPSVMVVIVYIFEVHINLPIFFLFLVCPEGYFGDHCMTPCECKNDNFFCHAAKGCICRHGLGGEDCNEALSLARIPSPVNPSSNMGSVIGGVIVAVIALVIAGFIYVYYRRRVSNLKTEIAHVQYIADPNAFSTGKFYILEYTSMYYKYGRFLSNDTSVRQSE